MRDGRFACGRVLIVPPWEIERMGFVGGLMDWVGPTLPSARTIAGSPILASASLHVKSIAHTGPELLGELPLSADELAPIPDPFDSRNLVVGFKDSVWGYGVILARAERRFVDGITGQ